VSRPEELGRVGLAGKTWQAKATGGLSTGPASGREYRLNQIAIPLIARLGEALEAHSEMAGKRLAEATKIRVTRTKWTVTIDGREISDKWSILTDRIEDLATGLGTENAARPKVRDFLESAEGLGRTLTEAHQTQDIARAALNVLGRDFTEPPAPIELSRGPPPAPDLPPEDRPIPRPGGALEGKDRAGRGHRRSRSEPVPGRNAEEEGRPGGALSASSTASQASSAMELVEDQGDTLSNQIDNLRQQLRASEARVSELEDQLRLAQLGQGDDVAHREGMRDLEGRLQGAEADNRGLQRQITALGGAAHEARQALEAMRAEQGARDAEQTRRLAAAVARADNLQAELQQLRDQRANTENRLQAMQGAVQAAQQQSEHAARRNEQLTGRLRAAVDGQAEAQQRGDALQARLEEQGRQIQEAEEAARRAEQVVVQLERELETARQGGQASGERVAELERQLVAQQEQLRAQAAEQDRLLQEHAQIEAQHRRATEDEAAARVQRIEALLAQERAQAAQAQSRLSNEVDGLRRRLIAETSRLQAVRWEQQHLEGAQTTLRTQLAEAERNLQNAREAARSGDERAADAAESARREIARLGDELDRAQQRSRELERDLGSAQQRIEQAERENRGLRDALTRRRDDAAAEQQALQQELASQARQLSDLQRQLEQVQFGQRQTAAELANERQRLQQLEAEVSRLRPENLRLQQALNDAQTVAQQAAARIHELEAERDAARRKRDADRLAFQARTASLADAVNRLASVVGVAQEEAQIAVQGNQADDLERQLTRITEATQDQAAELQRLRQQLAQQDAALHEVQTGALADRLALEQAREALRSKDQELGQLNQQITDLQDRLQAALDQQSAANEELAQLRNLQAQVQATEVRKQELEAETGRLAGVLEQLERNNVELRRQLAQAGDQRVQIEALQQELRQVNAAKVAAEAEKRSAEAAQRRKEQELAAVQTARNETADALRARLTVAEAQAQEAGNRVEALEHALTQLRAEFDRATELRALAEQGAQQATAQHEAERQRLSAELAQGESQLATAQQQLSDLQAHHRTELDRREAAVQEAIQSSSSAQADRDALQAELDRLRADQEQRAQTLNQQLSALEHELSFAQQQSRQLEAQQAEARAEIAQLQARLAHAEQSGQAASTARDRLREDLEAGQARSQALEQQNRKLLDVQSRLRAGLQQLDRDTDAMRAEQTAMEHTLRVLGAERSAGQQELARRAQQLAQQQLAHEALHTRATELEQTVETTRAENSRLNQQLDEMTAALAASHETRSRANAQLQREQQLAQETAQALARIALQQRAGELYRAFVRLSRDISLRRVRSDAVEDLQPSGARLREIETQFNQLRDQAPEGPLKEQLNQQSIELRVLAVPIEQMLALSPPSAAEGEQPLTSLQLLQTIERLSADQAARINRLEEENTRLLAERASALRQMQSLLADGGQVLEDVQLADAVTRVTTDVQAQRQRATEQQQRIRELESSAETRQQELESLDRDVRALSSVLADQTARSAVQEALARTNLEQTGVENQLLRQQLAQLRAESDVAQHRIQGLETQHAQQLEEELERLNTASQENETLRLRLADLEQEVAKTTRLTNDLSEARDRLQQMESTSAATSTELEALRNWNRDLQRQTRVANEARERLAAEKAAVEQRLAQNAGAHDEARDTLRSELDTARRELQSTQAELAASAQRREELEQLAERTQAAAGVAEAMQALSRAQAEARAERIEQLETELSSARAAEELAGQQNVQTVAQLSQRVQQLAERDQQIASQAYELERLRQELEASGKARDELSRMNEGLRADLAQGRIEASDLSQRLLVQQQSFERELMAREDTLAQLRQAVDGSKQLLETQGTELRSVDQLLQRKRFQLELAQAVQERIALSAEIVQLEEERRDQDASFDEAQAVIDSKIDEIQQSLQDARARLAESEATSGELVSQLSEQAERFEADMERMQGELQSAEVARENLTQQLRAAQSSNAMQSERHQSRIDEQQQELEQVRAQIALLRSRLSETEVGRSAAEAGRAGLELQNQRLEELNSQQRREIDTLQQGLHTLQAELSRLRDNRQRLEARQADLAQERDKLIHDLEQQTVAISRLSTNYAAAKSEATQQIQTLTEQIDALRAQRATIESQRTQAQNLVSARDALVDQFSTAYQRYRHLKVDVQQLDGTQTVPPAPQADLSKQPWPGDEKIERIQRAMAQKEQDRSTLQQWEASAEPIVARLQVLDEERSDLLARVIDLAVGSPREDVEAEQRRLDQLETELTFLRTEARPLDIPGVRLPIVSVAQISPRNLEEDLGQMAVQLARLHDHVEELNGINQTLVEKLETLRQASRLREQMREATARVRNGQVGPWLDTLVQDDPHQRAAQRAALIEALCEPEPEQRRRSSGTRRASSSAGQTQAVPSADLSLLSRTLALLELSADSDAAKVILREGLERAAQLCRESSAETVEPDLRKLAAVVISHPDLPAEVREGIAEARRAAATEAESSRILQRIGLQPDKPIQNAERILSWCHKHPALGNPVLEALSRELGDLGSITVPTYEPTSSTKIAAKEERVDARQWLGLEELGCEGFVPVRQGRPSLHPEDYGTALGALGQRGANLQLTQQFKKLAEQISQQFPEELRRQIQNEQHDADLDQRGVVQLPAAFCWAQEEALDQIQTLQGQERQRAIQTLTGHLLRELLGVSQDDRSAAAFLNALRPQQSEPLPFVQRHFSSPEAQTLLWKLALLNQPSRGPEPAEPEQLRQIVQGTQELLGAPLQEEQPWRPYELACRSAYRSAMLHGNAISLDQAEELNKAIAALRRGESYVIARPTGWGKTALFTFWAALLEQLHAEGRHQLRWVGPLPLSIQGAICEVFSPEQATQTVLFAPPPGEQQRPLARLLDEAHLVRRAQDDELREQLHERMIALTATPLAAREYLDYLAAAREQEAQRLENTLECQSQLCDALKEKLRDLQGAQRLESWLNEQLRLEATKVDVDKIRQAASSRKLLTPTLDRALEELGQPVELHGRQAAQRLADLETQIFNLHSRVRRMRQAGAQDLLPSEQALDRMRQLVRDSWFALEKRAPKELERAFPGLVGEQRRVAALVRELEQDIRKLAGEKRRLEKLNQLTELQPMAQRIEQLLPRMEISAPSDAGAQAQMRALFPDRQVGVAALVLPGRALTEEQLSETARGLLNAGANQVVSYRTPGQQAIDDQPYQILAVANGAPQARTASLKDIESLPRDQHTVLLYDWRSKQGGDFGRLSDASQHPQMQELVVIAANDPPLTQADLVQIDGRRRNLQPSSPSLQIWLPTGTDRDAFLRAAEAAQTEQEILDSLPRLSQRQRALRAEGARPSDPQVADLVEFLRSPRAEPAAAAAAAETPRTPRTPGSKAPRTPRAAALPGSSSSVSTPRGSAGASGSESQPPSPLDRFLESASASPRAVIDYWRQHQLAQELELASRALTALSSRRSFSGPASATGSSSPSPSQTSQSGE
jgi:chromosome segregation ATPase